MNSIKSRLLVELKSTFRNKRLKELFATIYFLVLINLILPWLLYYDIYFSGDNKLSVALQASGWCIFVLSIVYASLSFNWQGSYLPALCKSKKGVALTFTTAVLFPTLYSCLVFIIIFPSYYFLFPEASKWMMMFFLFNTGILFPSVFTISVLYNNKIIDLHKSRYLNFQGINLPNVMAILVPLFILMILIGLSKYLLDDFYLLPNIFAIAGIMISLSFISTLKKYFTKNIIQKLNY